MKLIAGLLMLMGIVTWAEILISCSDRRTSRTNAILLLAVMCFCISSAMLALRI